MLEQTDVTKYGVTSEISVKIACRLSIKDKMFLTFGTEFFLSRELKNDSIWVESDV